MGITYGDHLIDSGYYDITPEQEREIEERKGTEMTDWRKLTDREILDAMQTDTLVNRVRIIFSSEAARLEQAGMQRFQPTPIEWRRMEFEGAEKLIAAVSGAK